LPDQIGKKNHRAIEQRNDHGLAAAKIAFNLARHGPDAAFQPRVGDEHALDIPAPAGGNGGRF
jgi:hypothetical protein